MLIAIVVGALVVLLSGMALGAIARGYLLLPSDRRRLGELASRLHAEARIDAVSRATAHAMREVVDHHRSGR